MLTAETLHAEGPRYTAAIVCVPGLWSGLTVWRRFAGYLGHRGWESHLLEVRGVGGGIVGRATAVAEDVAELATPAVVLGHDAGGLIALEAARRTAAAAVVLIAPLVPGSRPARRLVLGARSLFALVAGTPVPPPARAWLDFDPVPAELVDAIAPDDAVAVRDVVWGRSRPAPAGAVPGLLLAGDRDALLPPAEARRLAASVGADVAMLEGAGHWPFVGPSWQRAVAVVHRWLVQRLGEPLLDLYAETMAERDAEDEDAE